MAVPDLHLCESTNQIVEKLFELKDEDTRMSTFASLPELAIFAGIFAIHKKKKPKKLKKQNKREVPGEVIENNKLDQVIDIAMLKLKKNIECLDPEKTSENYSLFEEYTNAGLHLLDKELKKEHIEDTGINQLLSELKEINRTKENNPDWGTIEI